VRGSYLDQFFKIQTCASSNQGASMIEFVDSIVTFIQLPLFT
jgi:hypothetical protein